MARKRRSSLPRADAPRREARPQPPAPAPAEPRFWFGFEVSWAKLVVGRVMVFALLACDALLAIRHAPRYGAGGFNVAQIIGLDDLGPTRASYAIGQLVLAYLFILAACGVATRIAVPLGAAIYSWLYFGSQLDSYQHHYLVALVLVIASFVPWQRPPDATPATLVRTWALRLILVQLAILYLWAAISKVDQAWLDGRALSLQILSMPDHLIDLRALIDATIGMTAVAKLVLATELALAVTIFLPRAWPYVAPVGILFHFGIVLTNFDIGLFAWLMMALYIFVVPDRVWIALASSPPGRLVRAIARRADHVGGQLGLCVLGILGGFGVALTVHFDHAAGIAVAAGLASLAIAGWMRRRGARVAIVGLAHVVAMVTWLAFDRGSDVTTDYYRFWGGSARRLGDQVAAEHAYRELIAIAPYEPAGHYQLGRLLLARNDTAAGLAALRRAQGLEPGRARAYVAEARWLQAQGNTGEAIAKAREATYAEPANADARALLDSLTGAKPSAVPERDEP